MHLCCGRGGDGIAAADGGAGATSDNDDNDMMMLMLNISSSSIIDLTCCCNPTFAALSASTSPLSCHNSPIKHHPQCSEGTSLYAAPSPLVSLDGPKPTLLYAAPSPLMPLDALQPHLLDVKTKSFAALCRPYATILYAEPSQFGCGNRRDSRPLLV
jgi:hypothetical protein